MICKVCGYKIKQNTANNIYQRYSCPSLHFRRQIDEIGDVITITDSYEISNKYAVYIIYDFSNFSIIKCKLREFNINKNCGLVISGYTPYLKEMDLPFSWAKLDFKNVEEILSKIDSLLLFE